MIPALIVAVLSVAVPAWAVWTPPIGIPNPGFCITEAAPELPSPWTAEVTNFYYVDFANGTDSGRPNGSQSAPRKTIPKVLASSSAPMVVVIAGSTYTQDHTSPNQLKWTGSASNPIYLRGISASTRGAMDAQITVADGASYVILEYLDWTMTGTARRPLFISTINGTTDHVCARYFTMLGNGTGTSAAAGITIDGFHTTNAVHDVVIRDGVISNFGDPAAVGDPDFHCLNISHNSGDAGAYNIWVLDNVLHTCQGDGLQVTSAVLAEQSRMHHYYIGRNVAHSNRQTGIWIKGSQDVIVSQNEAYNHRASASAFGPGFGSQYGSERLWFLFNVSHDNDVGFGFGSDNGLGAGTAHYLIGNLAYNNGPVSPSYDPADDFVAAGSFYSLTVGAVRHLVNNTFWGHTRGVTNTTPSTGAVHLVNNIIGPNTYTDDHSIFARNATSAAASDMTNNLVSATERISWGQTTVETLAQFQARTSKGQNSSNAQPSFVNAAGGNYRLATGSPAFDTGTTSSVYATFESLYGLSIAYDIAGTPRPIGAAWDIGAYEGTATAKVRPGWTVRPGNRFH